MTGGPHLRNQLHGLRKPMPLEEQQMYDRALTSQTQIQQRVFPGMKKFLPLILIGGELSAVLPTCPLQAILFFITVKLKSQDALSGVKCPNPFAMLLCRDGIPIIIIACGEDVMNAM